MFVEEVREEVSTDASDGIFNHRDGAAAFAAREYAAWKANQN